VTAGELGAEPAFKGTLSDLLEDCRMYLRCTL
jgi:hypothetical protein